MSTPARRASFVARPALALGLAAALAQPGCTKPAGNGSTAPDVHAGGSGTAAPLEVVPIEHPAQLLPRGTVLLLTASSVDRVAEVLERDRLVESFAPQYTSLRAVMVGSLGLDPLDPRAWPEMGLDPGGPVGLAMTSVAEPHVVLLATVSDRGKLVSFVRKAAGKAEVELLEEPFGNASILRPKGHDDDGVLVVRDRFAAIVLDTAKDQLGLARTMATMDPNVSLAAQAGYRKATGGMRAADGSLYLDVAGMIDQANANMRARRAEPSPNWALEELERAKAEGAPPERIAELQRQAAEVAASDERWRKRDEALAALGELVVSDVEGVALSASVKRSGPVLDGRVAAGPESLLRRMLVNRTGAPVLTVAMNGAPLWCASGRVEPSAALELVEAFALAEGADAGQLRADVKSELGFDLDADLLPALGGEAELCVAIDGAPGKGPKDPKEALGFGALVQTTDEAKAKYLLAKMATSGSGVGKRMKKRGEGYTVEVPEWKTVHLQPVGARVVITTDPDLGKRLAVGDPGAMPSKIRPPAAAGAMGLGGTAAVQSFDLSLGLLWTMAGRMSMSKPTILAPGLSPEQMEAVPHSAKAKKAKKALDKASANLEEQQQRRSAAEMDALLAITDGLGILVTAATEDDRGFTLTGGQFLRAESVGRVVESLLRGAITGLRSEGDAALDKAVSDAWSRYDEAQRAYSDARLEDAARWAKKKGIPGVAPVPSP